MRQAHLLVRNLQVGQRHFVVRQVRRVQRSTLAQFLDDDENLAPEVHSLHVEVDQPQIRDDDLPNALQKELELLLLIVSPANVIV